MGIGEEWEDRRGQMGARGGGEAGQAGRPGIREWLETRGTVSITLRKEVDKAEGGGGSHHDEVEGLELVGGDTREESGPGGNCGDFLLPT